MSHVRWIALLRALPRFLRKAQPTAAQPMSPRPCLFNVLLGCTPFASVPLVSLGPLPTEILPRRCDKTPRTPTKYCCSPMRRQLPSTRKMPSASKEGEVEGTITLTSSGTGWEEGKALWCVEETESERLAQKRRWPWYLESASADLNGFTGWFASSSPNLS